MTRSTVGPVPAIVLMLGLLLGGLGAGLLDQGAPAAAPPAAASAEWTVSRDLWYTLSLGGQECGWMNTRVEERPDRYRTTTALQMRIGRAGAAVEIGSNSVFEETRDGDPIRLELVQVTGNNPVVTEYEFTDDAVMQTVRQGGQQRRTREPLPQGDWLTPMEVERFTAARRAAGAKTIEYETIDGQQGLEPLKITETFQGKETVTLDGREVPVTVWSTQTSSVPIAAVSRISEDEIMVSSSMKFGIGDLLTSLSTREKALKVKGAALPEVMAASFVRPSRPIPNAMQQRRLALRLRTKDGPMPELPSAGAQRVAVGPDGATAELHIDIDDPLPASAEEQADKAYLAASSLVDTDDPIVRTLAETAVKRAAKGTTMEKAEELRAYVHRYIREKGLATAFATASEVARRRTGDCSEHAVLLCALLRANGIPARVASGLIYADAFAGQADIFGWHMWTQALIDGKWIDLDATLPQRYNAAHILVATSPLSGTAFDDSMAVTVSLIGNLEI
ncbi:MAG: transglutaminase domain-containing protein, partial [Phycisphaerales bacterium]|nr:transglutaminase domain-containing protein [Phycisphaerales bacterium]